MRFLSVLTAALVLFGCDSGSPEPSPSPSPSSFSFAGYAGTYTGQMTIETVIDGDQSTNVLPLTVTVVAGASPTVTLDPGPEAPGEPDPEPVTLTGSYAASVTTLRFPDDPPLVLDIAASGSISGSDTAQVFGGLLDVDATGSLTTQRFRLVLAATVREDLPSAPAGSTQTLTLVASR